jgi:hypothetical protein
VSLKEIPVKKAELLARLKQNRDDHRVIFEEALEGWHREALAELEARKADLAAGKRRTISIRKVVPEDHTSDYNRVIAMIEMSIDDTITLTESDFAQYVMDDWGWQGQFLSNTYGSSTATGKFSDRYVVG